MLKNKLKKRLFLIISSLFIILILWLFPTKEKEKQITEKRTNKEESIIYLLDQNNYVGRVSIYLEEKDKEKQIKEIINYLTIKSENSNYIKEGFKPIIPQNTKLLSLSIDKDLVKLNFNKNFFNIEEKDEDKLISAIIYSLTSIEGINKISIYIEGNILTKLPNSGKYLEPILDRTYGINHIYDLTNIKGTSKTTIYYLSKYNDYYYYVPVTLINNNDKDKIEIIIDELSSKSVYQTGLISYLKNIQKMSYEQNQDTLLINLNSELFNTLNNNQIETILYSINLSIKDNYQVKKVIYNINNSYQTYSI